MCKRNPEALAGAPEVLSFVPPFPYEDRDGEMRATRKGLSLNVALLLVLIKGLQEALAQAETAGRLYGEA